VSRYGLCGKFVAQPGQRDALLAELLHAAELLADAPGCDVWIVGTIPDEPDSLWVSELWQSEADHDASLTREGVRAVISRARPLIAAMPLQVGFIPAGGRGLPGAA
jgi:quinol monooxygenase YgiN